jgi:hypothetical protein
MFKYRSESCLQVIGKNVQMVPDHCPCIVHDCRATLRDDFFSGYIPNNCLDILNEMSGGSRYRFGPCHRDVSIFKLLVQLFVS